MWLCFLYRFGALCDDLLPNVLVLLSRCMMDADDEVRRGNPGERKIRPDLFFCARFLSVSSSPM